MSPIFTTHTGNTETPHEVTKTQVGLGNVDNVQQIPASEKGANNGVATLDGGKVPASQLPALLWNIKVLGTYRQIHQHLQMEQEIPEMYILYLLRYSKLRLW